MKAWRFKIKSSPKQIIEKLESELKSIGGFVLDTSLETNKSISFKLRKRILYAWYMAFQNWTVVSGKIKSNHTDNHTNVKIVFNQHFFIRLIILTHIILGLGVLIALISGTNLNVSMFILGGTLISIGIILWIVVKRKFDNDIEKYKLLITKIFEL